MVRDRMEVVATTVASLVVLIGSFLPWLRSGRAERSSYEIFELVDRLGFAPDGAVGWALRLWPLLPLLLALTVVAAWAAIVHPASFRWIHVVTGVVAGCYALGVSTAVRLAPEAGLFQFRVGTWVTLVGAVALLAAIGSQARALSRRGSGDAAAS